MLKSMTSSKRVRFKSTPTKDNFIKDLRRRVDHYFESNNISPYANTEMYIKTALAIVAWTGTFALIMSGMLSATGLFFAYIFWGFVNIFIAFNIMHDATHDAYSANQKVNNFWSYSMDFIGGNQYLFRRMHGAHHGYVNIHGIDVTLETHGQFRFSPDEPWLPKHKWQHFYTFGLYALAMIHWVTVKDAKWFFAENNIGNQKNIKHPTREYVILFIGKLFYYGTGFILPMIFLEFSNVYIFFCWFMMHILPGLTFALMFQVTHVYEGTTYPLPDDDGNIDNNYALHVLETTADFCRHSKLGTWLMGAINIHVIHHIYPKVCHVHYSAITEILKQTCDDHGILYQENETFGLALKKHYQILKHLSKPDAEVARVGKSATMA